ncbi:DUF4124 domain-containing protein [Xanthomonas arboricola pv. corylina]|uniref:DUF4124 domain-containing protein n=2 Tax=Xanthomonas arboricola TaxID=56448 RepID=A0A8E4EVA5_XANCJ|nr:DUF4124 domain-containing protein [Xanthomonas axonopodis pv. begoniae]UQP98910.1 DUF4124 domain-containing protein [Xanthomonas arboricola pv. juglandis]CAD2255915.1 DUF4124 domain-containing protein [Xanthomonas arboricola]UQQ03868.1 DUF4124 domain-containing protein [Xanthomonas arboricola pv. juglandis]CAD1794157.1 DUF4124 domain-containing protein [Xanthomonas arboricola pv. juglandis]
MSTCRSTPAILMVATLIISTHAHSATLYKCYDQVGAVRYTAKPTEGEQCTVVSNYQPSSPSASAPAILRSCLDPAGPGNASLFVSPSLRAEECTRVLCAEPGMRAKVRAYALSDKQSPDDSLDSLTCLARKKIDATKK